jgi:4-amino-4-deoxychorismate lyase
MQFNLITDLNNRQPDLQDRALHYGDGLFETMLLRSGDIPFWDLHYQRLSKSARRLGIKCPHKDWFETQLEPFAGLNQNLVIKILLSRGSGGRGITLPDGLTPTIYILHYPYVKNPNNQYVKACISEVTLSKNRNLAGLKHLNRLDYVLATQALSQMPDYNEAILCNDDGDVIESILHNLFFVINNELCTPDLSECGVEGVFRQSIINALKKKNIDVNIGVFGIESLMTASECFLCNSVQGIRPVILIQDEVLSAGPVTQRLQQEFHGFTGH